VPFSHAHQLWLRGNSSIAGYASSYEMRAKCPVPIPGYDAVW
jgi:hypothetical protein